MPSASSRRGYEYSLHIKGLCGRDKKPKTYAFTILETENEEKAVVEAIEVLVAQKVREQRYKYGSLVVVQYPVIIDDRIAHSGRAIKSKQVEVSRGEVVFRSTGYNLPLE